MGENESWVVGNTALTMTSIPSKICKNQRNITPIQEKTQSIETNSEMTKRAQLADSDTNTAL
jgi:hypothetical protein